MVAVTNIGDTVSVNATNSGTVGLSVSANTNVTLIPEGTVDGVSWGTLTAFPLSGSPGVRSIATVGAWTITSAGMMAVRARVSAIGATPSATVTLSPSTAAAPGIAAGITSYGSLLVASDPTNMFFDPFDGGAVDTANTWTTQTATGTVTQATGSLSLDSSTTTLAYAGIFSKAAFPPNLSAVLSVFAIQLENPIKANVRRFWGLGTLPGTPTVTIPITDGYGFELTEAGVFRGVVYASGVAVQTAALTAPTDALVHNYLMYFRGDALFFHQDGVQVGVIYGPSANNNTLPVCMVAVNAATPPTAGQNMKVTGAALGDFGKNTNQIADGLFPWRKMTVTSGLSGQVVSEFTQRRTYSAAANIAVSAAATDIATISGSASTTVYVTKVIVSGIQTAASLADIQLIKRSTADTGGTSTAMTAIPHDASDAAAAAIALSYTANPTVGTPIGALRRSYAPIGAATSVVNPVVVFDFGATGRPITLRGVAQQLCVNLGGATLAGGTFNIDFEWFEI